MSPNVVANNLQLSDVFRPTGFFLRFASSLTRFHRALTDNGPASISCFDAFPIRDERSTNISQLSSPAIPARPLNKTSIDFNAA